MIIINNKYRIESVVNPANHFISQGGGLSRKIYKTAGIELNELLSVLKSSCL